MLVKLYKKLGFGGVLLAGSTIGALWALWGVLRGIPVSYLTTCTWTVFLILASMLVCVGKADEQSVRLRLRMAILMFLAVGLAMMLHEPVDNIIWVIIIWRGCDVGLMYQNWKVMHDAEQAELDAAVLSKFSEDNPPRIDTRDF